MLKEIERIEIALKRLKKDVDILDSKALVSISDRLGTIIHYMKETELVYYLLEY